jgi:hypothetical protein
MKFYHRTDAAEAILAEGFRDFEDFYMFSQPFKGVFLSDVPLDCNEGTKGDQLLEVVLPDDLDIDYFEIVEEDSTYREWIFPADLLNRCGKVRLLGPKEAEKAEEASRADLL